jgi:hypothetical protein
MEWLTNAEDYLGRFGWGASGRMGISRMFTEQDKVTMGKENVVASLRPRGILSGFLAVVPTFGYAVYIPHMSSKLRPLLLRMRLSDTLIQEGAIFSAYLTRDNTLIVEDAIVWGKQTVWTKHTFAERWMRYVKELFQQFTPDRELQSGISIRPAEHTTLQALQEPSENQLIEFIPNTANTKRILWMRPMRPMRPKPVSAKPEEPASAKPASAKPTLLVSEADQPRRRRGPVRVGGLGGTARGPPVPRSEIFFFANLHLNSFQRSCSQFSPAS